MFIVAAIKYVFSFGSKSDEQNGPGLAGFKVENAYFDSKGNIVGYDNPPE